eukprot:15331239-Ditylum_brightwellii.AAC.1
MLPNTPKRVLQDREIAHLASIRCRSQRLKLKKVSPIAACKAEKGAVMLITEKDIESVLQLLARKLYGITNAEELR